MGLERREDNEGTDLPSLGGLKDPQASSTTEIEDGGGRHRELVHG